MFVPGISKWDNTESIDFEFPVKKTKNPWIFIAIFFITQAM